jgi:DNA-binding response OmpR family regulator
MTAARWKILVVDDTEPNLRLLRALLTGAGYDVVTAGGGADGIAAAARENPDLILLDIMMPDITGFEVCQRLRATAETHRTPIVFLTALHEMEDHMRAVDVGGDDVLTKPINKLELLLRVKSLLRIRELTGETAQQSRLIHALLKSYVSDEAAERYLTDPASVNTLDRLPLAP